MLARIGIRLVLLVAVGSTIACDRITKHVAASALAGKPGLSFLVDTVRLEYVENAGGFLGLGATLPPATRRGVFTVGTGIMLLSVLGAALHFRVHGWPLLGVALFVAGGASNWMDRVLQGSVVDFLNVGLGPVRTGIFNVADVAILLGAGIVLLEELRPGRSVWGSPEPCAQVPGAVAGADDD